jgi:hypothetical protein
MAYRMKWVLPLLVLPALVGAEPTIKVLEHTGRWESGYGSTWYSVVGRLRNTGDAPVTHVKLRLEALDAAGKPVASADAYNESAEAMSVVVEGEPGGATAPVAAAKVMPLAPGAEERFRGGFLKEETPPFESYRVTVVEAPPAR